ncbi:unnamed protein product [Gordionus sp. m RMFG-2023]
MQFMKRTKVKEDEATRQLYITKSIEDEKECKVLFESSLMICYNFSLGRLSYKGFNPEIEKSMNPVKEEPPIIDETISEETMAHRYATLVNNISNRFLPKKEKRKIKSEKNAKRRQHQNHTSDVLEE